MEKRPVTRGKATGFLVFVIIFLAYKVVNHVYSALFGAIVGFLSGILGDPILVLFVVALLFDGVLLGIRIATSVFLLILAILLRRKWLIAYAIIDVVIALGLQIGLQIIIVILSFTGHAMAVAMVSLANGLFYLGAWIALYALLFVDARDARISTFLPPLLVALVAVAFVLGPLLRFMLPLISIEIIHGSILDIGLHVLGLVLSTGITALLVAHFLIIFRGLARETHQAEAKLDSK